MYSSTWNHFRFKNDWQHVEGESNEVFMKNKLHVHIRFSTSCNNTAALARQKMRKRRSIEKISMNIGVDQVKSTRKVDQTYVLITPHMTARQRGHCWRREQQLWQTAMWPHGIRVCVRGLNMQTTQVVCEHCEAACELPDKELTSGGVEWV